MQQFASRQLPVYLFAITIATLLGCKAGSVEAQTSSASSISGPPTMNAEYGVRNPRVCAKVTRVPDQATAQALVQCNAERFFDHAVWVVTDLQVEMGSPRAMTQNDTDINDLDATAKIYPLRGQATNWACSPVSERGVGTNCQKFYAAPNNTGRCWHTLFGEWKCSMGVGSSQFVVHQPGPTTY